MHTRKYKKKSRFYGGQIVPYDIHAEWHGNWRPLNVHSMDCGANCFSLLGYSTWDTGNELAKRTPEGMHSRKIVEILNEAYGEGHLWFDITNFNEYTDNDDFTHINNHLAPNQATMASFGSDDLIHYFVVVRNVQGHYAIDAQQGETGDLLDYLLYLKEIGFKGPMRLLSSPHPSSEHNQVTLEMVKRYFPYKKQKSKSRHKSKNKSKKGKSHSRSVR